MEFARQEHWSGLPFLSPGELLVLGIESMSLVSPAFAGRLLPLCHLGSYGQCQKMKSVLIRLKQEAQELPTLSQSPWGTHMLRVVPILPGLPTTLRSEGHWPGSASGLCWEELEEKWLPHTAVAATEPKGDAKLKAHWCGGAKAAKAKKGMWVCCHPRRGSQAILGSQRRNEIRGSEIQEAGEGATVAVGPGGLVWLCKWPVSKFQAEVRGWAPSLGQWNANCIRYLAGGLIFPPLY